MSVTLSSTVKARGDVFATSVDDDLVLFDPEQGSYYGTGPVGEKIWSGLSKAISVEALCEMLSEEFDVDRKTCAIDVTAFLTELEERKLIVVT